MNDAWDPMDELEPLDDASLGLLASYREAEGPSADAEARMLAGLRARIASEAFDGEPATAVQSDEAPRRNVDPTEAAKGRARTFAVAAVAFAAGVALTVSLDRGRNASQENPDDGAAAHVVERVVYRDGSTTTPQPVVPSVRPLGSAGAADASDAPSMVVEAEAPLPWPLSITEPAPTASEPTGALPSAVDEEPTAVESHSTAIDDGREPSESHRRTRERTADDSGPVQRRRTNQTTRTPRDGDGHGPLGAWAPSVSSSPSVPGVSSVARNPAVGGSPAPAMPSPSPSDPSTPPPSNSEPGDRGGDEPPPRDAEPPPEPSPDDPSDEPPPEDDPIEDEVPLEEACDEAFHACFADAESYCAWNIDGCDYAIEFCGIRHATCLGGEPQMPFPHPDEPQPHDCYFDYDMCMAEIDAMCMFEKTPEEECDLMWLHCEDMLTACETEEPW